MAYYIWQNEKDVIKYNKMVDAASGCCGSDIGACTSDA